MIHRGLQKIWLEWVEEVIPLRNPRVAQVSCCMAATVWMKLRLCLSEWNRGGEEGRKRREERESGGGRRKWKRRRGRSGRREKKGRT